MKIFTWLLFIISINLTAQNMFRLYQQAPPPATWTYNTCDLAQPVKTSDGGYMLSASPWSANIHSAYPIDFFTVKTNPQYAPLWKKSMLVKTVALPSGRMITLNSSVDDIVFPASQLSKLSNAGSAIWTQSLSVPAFGSTRHEINITDFDVLGSRIVCVGYKYTYDAVNVNTWHSKSFIVEYDTSGTIISQVMAFPTMSTSTGPNNGFNRVIRNNAGEYLVSDHSYSAIHKFNSTLNALWSFSYLPRKHDMIDAYTFANGDIFCLFSNNEYWAGDTNSVLVKLSSTGSVIFAKEIKLFATFSGMEHIPGGNFVLTGILPRKNPNDTVKNVVLMVDSNANFLWARKQMESKGISKALYNNNKILFTSFNKSLLLETGDLNGNFPCTNVPITVTIATTGFAMGSAFTSMMPSSMTMSAGLTYTNSNQIFTDTCGGIGTSIPEMINRAIGISPNPSSGKFRILSEQEPEGMEIEVTSLTGIKVQTLILSSDEIDLQHLVPGVYFLTLMKKGYYPSSKKVIIQR